MGSVGEQLRRGREAARLSPTHVADQTKMRTDHVTALEEGNYDVFVAPVYIRGFARTYARLLKLDEAAVLRELDLELAQTEKFREHPSLLGAEQTSLDRLMLVFSRVRWRCVLPVALVRLVVLVIAIVERSARETGGRDPLAGLGSGKYVARESGPGLTLPLPTNTTVGGAVR